jgi:hypothetical protein
MNNVDKECFEGMKKEISQLKIDMVWVKRVGYYISGIMTLQLVAIIGTNLR